MATWCAIARNRSNVIQSPTSNSLLAILPNKRKKFEMDISAKRTNFEESIFVQRQNFEESLHVQRKNFEECICAKRKAFFKAQDEEKMKEEAAKRATAKEIVVKNKSGDDSKSSELKFTCDGIVIKILDLKYPAEGLLSILSEKITVLDQDFDAYILFVMLATALYEQTENVISTLNKSGIQWKNPKKDIFRKLPLTIVLSNSKLLNEYCNCFFSTKSYSFFSMVFRHLTSKKGNDSWVRTMFRNEPFDRSRWENKYISFGFEENGSFTFSIMVGIMVSRYATSWKTK